MAFESSHALAAVVVSSVFLGLAFVTVSLRLYAQGLKGQTFTVDGMVLVAALIVTAGLVGLTIWGALHGGLGWPAMKLLGPTGLVFQKVVYAGQILWAVSITLVRISLLVFYRRVFPTRKFRIADSVMLTLTVAWFVTTFVGTLAAYDPSRASQTSINYPVWLLVNAILNMLLDIATLCLPLFVIRTLRVSTKKKFMLFGIFWLGVFCIVASIVRVHYFRQLSHITQRDRSFSGTTFYCFIWSVVEPCVSIIAACLPASAPLINKDTRGFSLLFRSFKSLFSLRSSRGDSTDFAYTSREPKISSSTNSSKSDTSRFTWRMYQKDGDEDMEMMTRAEDDRDVKDSKLDHESVRETV